MEAGQIILIFIALIAANLPFLSERIFFLIQPSANTKPPEQATPDTDEDIQQREATPQPRKKNLGWRLLELVALYFVVGGAAYLLESRLATPHQQNWEFYAITACLFVVFAYPGFVAKYLWNARGR